MKRNYDFSNAVKNPYAKKLKKTICINISESVLAYFKELSMYILAGKKKLKEVRETELPALQKKAAESGLPEDAQAAKDLADQCDRFEKKLHDLQLTRAVAMQTGPQIRRRSSPPSSTRSLCGRIRW